MDHVSIERDLAMRTAAFRRVAELMADGPIVSSAELDYGFEFEEQRIRLMGAQQGIWKPRQMQGLLSVRTMLPKSGKHVHADQLAARDQILNGADAITYDYQGKDAYVAANRWLKQAVVDGTPIIYLLGMGNQKYILGAPAYVATANDLSLQCQIVFGSMDRGPMPGIPGIDERREGMRIMGRRLRQALGLPDTD